MLYHLRSWFDEQTKEMEAQEVIQKGASKCCFPLYIVRTHGDVMWILEL